MTGSHQLLDTVRGFVGPGYGLVWLNADGSLDTTRVHRKVAPWGWIKRIHELPDGKFICSGGGGLFEGDSISNLTFRVHPDGSLDTTFLAPSIDFTSIWNFLPVENDKVLLFGRFHVIGMPDTLSLVRLLPNGQLDPTFHNHAVYSATYHHLATPSVRGVRRISEGLLAVTGDFDRIDGQTRGGIAMLDTAGNLLPGYFEGSGCGGFYWPPLNPGQYPYQFIVGIKEAMDGSYYIYGSYHGFDDGTTNDPNQRLISRLYGLNVGIPEHAPPRPLTIAPNPASGAVQLSVGAAPVGAALYVHDASGRVVLQQPWPAGAYTHTLEAGTLAPGVYVLRVAAQPLSVRAQPRTEGASQPTGPPLYTGRLVVVP
ncbi:MAG TPA: T9SS type A sorting domain-containing protein [Flavobacteriales bacterium]|nr:T9SS type A sorting domain-containing protein [Flavobacteriales bacterium]